MWLLIFNLWWLSKSQQWLFDGARECIHLRPGLCGEKQRPHAEERSAGKNFIPNQTTAVETTSWRAWSHCRTPAAETLQCFRRRLLVGLVANIGRGKDGSDRRTGHPQFETFIFICCALVLCTFSLFHACFLAFGAADRGCQSMSLDSVGVTRVWNLSLRLVRPNYGGEWGSWRVTASPPPIDKER